MTEDCRHTGTPDAEPSAPARPAEPAAEPSAADASAAAAGETELVECVVEVESMAPVTEGLSRMEQIALRKESFARDATPVAEAIARAGGEVVGQAWINQTIKARLPRHAVDAVAGHAKVQQISAPRKLELEEE